jgi:hypothetical protein
MILSPKQIYCDYLGDKFGMWHDGVLEEYERHPISPNQEAEWRKELIAFWVARLSAEDVAAVIKLSALNAVEALSEILPYARQGNSYAQLIYANALCEIASWTDNPSLDPQIASQARQKALQLWQSIAAGPVVLTAHRDVHPPDESGPSV